MSSSERIMSVLFLLIPALLVQSFVYSQTMQITTSVSTIATVFFDENSSLDSFAGVAGASRIFIADIDNDNRSDTIIHYPDSNIFVFKYGSLLKKKTRTIVFFKNYPDFSVHMDISVEKKMLRFDLRFAPRFLNKDSLWFKYDNQKDDWYLVKLKTYRHNPSDIRSITTNCYFLTPKPKISLRANYYDRAQEYLDSPSKHFLKRKCRSYSDPQ